MVQKSKGCISVEDLVISVKKGLYDSEVLLENDFLISASVEYDTEDLRAGEYLDYAELAGILKSNMLKPVHLLEKVAGSILEEVRNRWPVASSIRVKIKKINPHFEHRMSAVVVEITWFK